MPSRSSSLGSPTRKRVVRQKAKGPIDPSFGEKVRALRSAKRMTQAELAGSDFTKAFISHIETGRTRVSLRAAGIIAERLGVHVTDLLVDPRARRAAALELSLVLAERELAAGRARSALETADRALPQARGRDRAQLLRIRGRALIDIGSSKQAVASLTDAVRQATLEHDQELRTRALYDLANAHAHQDEPGEALGLLIECERAVRVGEIVDRQFELRVQALLAGVYWRLGDVRSADVVADRATRLAEDVVDPVALDTLYATLFSTRREQGDLEGALLWARKSLALHEREGRESDAIFTWLNLASIYTDRAQYARASEAIHRAEGLATARRIGTRGAVDLARARLALARGDYSDALEQAERVRADPDARSLTRALAALVEAEALAGTRAPLPKVRAAFERAIASHKNEPPKRQARVHEAYAVALEQRGLIKEAYVQSHRALARERGREGA